MAAGALRSDGKLVVSVDGDIITIMPPTPQEVDYPAYNPEQAYGPWPYPDFPPYAFDDIDDGCEVGDFGYCWFDVGIVGPLWGWDRWDWRGRRIILDPGRYADLNGHRPPSGGSVWTHERGHRHGVPYQDAATRARYPAAAAASDLERAARGFPAAGFDRPRSSNEAGASGRAFGGGFGSRETPSFESHDAGAFARTQEERGMSSRMSSPGFSSFPSRGASAPSGGRRR
jgi:hypothetical protein